ncbi:uncharacterized protein TNCV_2603911 [Trichonephila clavipes]|nr:uncharacterized protein TNCV_2603911 [Trichonephila clavipes]
MDSCQVYHEFESCTTKEPPCRGANEHLICRGSKVLPLVWCGSKEREVPAQVPLSSLDHDQNCELWFQQDGATCPTARATIDLLKDTFGDRLISRFGPVNWPPRSCDLTPLDYFLWGYVKSLVYADKPQTLDHLEDNIRRVIADIRPQMLEKVIENWTSRLDYIRDSRGSPMPEIIFKITWKHGTTPLRVKEDIEDVSSELGHGGERLHFLDETSKTLLLSAIDGFRNVLRQGTIGPRPRASATIGASSRS